MTTAVVIGKSHCEAIVQAIASERADVTDITVHRLDDPKRPHVRNTISAGDAVSLVRGLPAGARVFLSVLGTYHNIWGLLRSGQNFDFLLDQHDAVDPNAEVRIPHRAVASAFERHLVKPPLIQKIQAATNLPVFLLSTPPPKQSNEFILERFMNQKNQSYHGKSVEEVGLERPESRLKLWLMENRAIADWAAREGMEFVPPPAGAFDRNGFLDPRFYSDATHANAQYGALIIDQIRAMLNDTRKDAAHG